FATTLASGTHTITAKVTDSVGNTGSSSVTITVMAPANNSPKVIINSPANASSYPYGTAISFSGSASDDEDGNLTSKLFWTSSIDGTIGTGGGFAAILSSGTHTITAKVADSAGNTATASVTITINSFASTAPTVTITYPITGFPFLYGTPILLAGSAFDL